MIVISGLLPEVLHIHELFARPTSTLSEGRFQLKSGAHINATCKKTAYFINIGRGKTTKLDELTDAVANGVIAGCGLDVFETEPLPAGHRLWKLPNALITPHVAVRDGVHVEERRFQIMVENAR